MPAQENTQSDKPKMMMRAEVVEEETPPAVAVAKPVEAVEPVPAPTIPATEVSDLARLPLSTVADIAETAGTRSSGGWGWIWVGLAFAVGIAAGALGIYFGKPMKPPELPKIVETGDQTVPEVNIVPTKPAATPTAAVVKRAELRLQVLNGSGIKGKAAEAKQYLQSFKYQVLATGNADADSYEIAEIAIKADKKDYGPTLLADLKAKYEVSETIGTLDTGSKYDAVVILGKK